MAELDPPVNNRDWLRRTRDEVRAEVAAHEVLRREIERAHGEIVRAHREMDRLRQKRDDVVNALQAKALELDAIQQTRSWALAQRLQAAASLLRRDAPEAREAVPAAAPEAPEASSQSDDTTDDRGTEAGSSATKSARARTNAAVPWPRSAPANTTTPSVSIIIPTRDRPSLVRGVLETIARTNWPALEVIFVDNGTIDAHAIAAMDASGHRRIRADIPFNFPQLIAVGANASSGDVLILLNNDIETDDSNWVAHLVESLEVPGCGVAGALLLDPDGFIQHCGLAIESGVPIHALGGMAPADAPHGALDGVHLRTAVTGACMALTRETWTRLNGMDDLFAHNFNDVDLCLRAATLGLTTVCTSRTSLMHHESATRGRDWSSDVAAEWLLFRARWTHLLSEPDRFWPRDIRPSTGAVVEG